VLCTKSSTNRVGDEQVNEVLPRTVLAVHPSTKAKLLRPAAWGVTSSMTSATNDSVRTPELTAIDSVRTPEPTTNDSVRTPESTMVAASTPGHQEPNPLLAASTTGLRGPDPLVAASTPGCQGPKRLPSSPKALGSAVNGGREHTWLPRAQTSALFHQGSGGLQKLTAAALNDGLPFFPRLWVVVHATPTVDAVRQDERSFERLLSTYAQQ
jgi:hypothetical protein